MSGPKHSAFDVRENELRRQRERAAALAEAAKLGRELEGGLTKLVALDPDAAVLLRNDFASLQSLTDGTNHPQLLAVPAQMRALLDRASAALGRSQARKSRQEALSSSLAEGNDEVARNEAKLNARKQAERERWLAPILEQLADLRPRANASELVRIQRIEALAKDAAQARESLKFDIMAIESAIGERIAAGREAAELRLQLVGHSDPVASGLVRDLLQAEAGNLKITADMRSRAKREIARLEMDEDRRFVAQVLADGFRELGYAVDEGFVTAFERGEPIEIGRPDDQPYAAQLKFDRNSLEVDSELVVVEDRAHLTAEAIAHDDRIAEQSWCGDLAKVLSAARSRGIHGTAKPKRRIGAAPVRSIATQQLGGAGRSATAGHSQQTARTLKP